MTATVSIGEVFAPLIEAGEASARRREANRKASAGKRPTTVWECQGHRVAANTKSEARAMLKTICRIYPLPRGQTITRGEPRS